MSIVRDLVTRLSFTLDKTKLNEFNSILEGVRRKSENTRQTFSKVLSPLSFKGGSDIGSSKQNSFTQSNDANPLNILSPLQARIMKITAYKRELESLSYLEKKEVLELNATEKQAIRELSTEKRKADAEEKQRRLEIDKIKKQEAKANIFNGLNKVNQLANRALVGLVGGVTASLTTSYSEYKKYKKQREAGGIVKTTLTSDQIQKFKIFDQAFTKFGETIANIRNTFSVALLPAINQALKEFNAWYKLNQAFVNLKVKQYADDIVEVFKKVKSIVTGVTTVLAPLINMFGGLSNVLTLLIGIKVISWFVTLAAVMSSPLVGAITVLTSAFFLLTNASFWSKLSDNLDSLISQYKTLIDKVADFLGLTNKMTSWKVNVEDRKKNFVKGQQEKQRTAEFLEDTKSSGILWTPPAMQFLNANKYLPSNRQLDSVVRRNETATTHNKVGDIHVNINHTGNIDNASLPWLAKLIDEKIIQGLSDQFSLTKANQTY